MTPKNSGKKDRKRRPYQRPRMNSQAIYERYGLACGKTMGNPACLKKASFNS